MSIYLSSLLYAWVEEGDIFGMAERPQWALLDSVSTTALWHDSSLCMLAYAHLFFLHMYKSTLVSFAVLKSSIACRLVGKVSLMEQILVRL